MLNSIEPIYNTLFDTIAATDAYPTLATFDRGFWYKGKDCAHKVDLFPYGFLDQPSWTEMIPESSPMGFQFQVSIELVILTFATDPDKSGLFFPEQVGADPTGMAAVELLLAITQEVYDRYAYGLPFVPSPVGWHLLGWRYGEGGPPSDGKLSHYFENPNIAGASVFFLFDVHEYGPYLKGA